MRGVRVRWGAEERSEACKGSFVGCEGKRRRVRMREGEREEGENWYEKEGVEGKGEGRWVCV